MVKTIEIEELRQITESIFDHILNVLEVKQIDVKEDMYWSIPSDELYCIEKEPKNFGIGQLYDDVDFLSSITTNKNHAVPAMFMHLAPILQYLSTQINWYEAQKIELSETTRKAQDHKC